MLVNAINLLMKRLAALSLGRRLLPDIEMINLVMQHLETLMYCGLISVLF